jgi:hypothetical protein
MNTIPDWKAWLYLTLLGAACVIAFYLADAAGARWLYAVME